MYGTILVMQCPACRYQMTAFEATCPRCQGKGLGTAAPAPVAAPHGTVPPMQAPPYGVPPYGMPPQQQNYSNDGPSFLMALIGFFIPLVGFILWLAMKDSTPRKALSAARGALLNIGLTIGGSLFIIFLLTILGGSSAPR